MLAAIFVAAGIFLTIYQTHETTAAHDALSAEMMHTRAYLPEYGAANRAPVPTPRSEPIPILVETLQIKTVDGLVVIPKGTVMRVLPEKSKPGTIVINYEGYSLTIPSTSVALSLPR